MKPLPDNILRRMSKQDRAGQLTAAEVLLKQEIQNEGQLQKQIISWLTLKDIFVISSRFGVKSKLRLGTPDLCFCWIEMLDGCPYRRPVALEVKFGKNDLSDEQEKVKPQMILNGWLYYTVRSLNEVIEIVRL